MNHPRRGALRRRSATLLTAVALLMAGMPVMVAGSASAAPVAASFETSFEAADPAPDWTNEPEIGPDGEPRTSGVTGRTGISLRGDVTGQVAEVSASGDNPPNEVAANLIDGDAGSKWLVFERTAWVRYQLDEPVAVRRYSLTAADDAPERDPRDWTLQGSQDGTSWTDLDKRTGQDLGERRETTTYELENDTAYRWYRLNVTANHGAGLIQLAELRISNGDNTEPPASPMRVEVGDGPVSAYTARARVGFTGVAALRYGGEVTDEAGGHAWAKVYDVDVPVTPASELSYRIFPGLTGGDLRYPSTYAAVDLAFTDGTYLSDLGALDQNGFGISPRDQGESKSLYAKQWNHRAVSLGQVAAGKVVDRVLVGYDSPHGDAEFSGWIDDVTVAPADPVDADQPSDYVETTRGTNSNGSFSRGNNIPATAVPHGFNFWSPVTDAGSLRWIYAYADDNDAQNRTRLQALSLSHETSPWMGDRQTFQVMPSVSDGKPTADREARSMPFSHDDEVASPHYYGVTLENGLVAEVAPTDHAAVMRFTFPGDDASLVFDNVNNDGGLSIDEATGTVTGFADTRSGLSVGASRMYVYGVLDSPVTESGAPVAGEQRPAVSGYVRLDAGTDRTVELRLATSLISLEQARRNLEMEVADASFEDVRDRAQTAWDDVLDVIEVEGATTTQLTTLYSNLYRLSLYPNSGHENVGTAAAPVWKHASPVAPADGPSSPTQTGAKVVDGKIYVNNGFWDTYRTTWPAYSLLYPEMAGEMVDGFVQQYREGGWVSRWSSPGYANLMTGTSSDISFADAYTKGVKGFDAVDAYDAAVRNATVAPPGANPNNTDVGRKGLEQSIFLGYTPDEVSEGVSWALEGYINDYGIARMGAELAKDRSLPAADRARYREESEYFLDRSRRYREMFDPAIGFFQGKDASGEWKSTPEEYDPELWGHDHDYTETNGWNFAFHVPFDGAGLAELYGGRDALAEKLDTFFSTPETGTKVGSYGGVIHEMIEARDVRMGMWGFSNQVSHHIPWMYTHTGQPWKTQRIVREVLSRHYTGSEIGQGYAGDEDNGETSAWWVFSALGFYPLQLGSETYAAGSPLFTKATVHLENGEDLVIEAPENSAENVFVQGVTIDGESWDKPWFEHADLANGAVVRFDMGSEPSEWGSSKQALPSSPSDGKAPAPLADATGGEAGFASGVPRARRLFDDTSGTVVELPGNAAVQYRFTSPRQLVSRYTLTSGTDAGDPKSWVLEGSRDGTAWSEVDRRTDEKFRWRQQTRPFQVDKPHAYRYYRLRVTDVTGSGPTSLAEIELFGVKAKPISDEEWVEETLAGIDLGDTSAVTEDVELPTGPSYAWKSSEPSLVTDEGRLVRRPEVGQQSESAALTVTVSRGDASGTRDFEVTVAPWTQEEWEATGTDLETSFENGQPGVLFNAWLEAVGVEEFCCGIGGMETVGGSPPDDQPKTGNRILLYSGRAAGDGPASATNAAITAPSGTWVRPTTTLSWWILPESGNGRVSTFVGLDLQFTDGTYLHDLQPMTVGGESGHPRDLGEVLTNDTWQQVTLDVGAVAAGRQVQSIALSFDSGDRDGPFRGFVDDVVLERKTGVTP